MARSPGLAAAIDADPLPPPARRRPRHRHRRAESAPDRYDYDPADPTPAVGGAVIGRHAGARDNRRLESRPDVLVYTSAQLERDLELIGPVAAELHVRSSLAHTDFFTRLCDVAPNGRSTNVCDGLVRLAPGRLPQRTDGTTCVRIELSPTACCFRRGNRLRLQVSSGAHPRFSRNPGSGRGRSRRPRPSRSPTRRSSTTLNAPRL